MFTPSFGNIGLNYQVLGNDWAAHRVLFKKQRPFPNKQIPLNIVNNNNLVSIPWQIGTANNDGNFADSRNCALFFASDPAFDVSFNMFYGPMTNDSWPVAHDAMVAEATYLQTLGVPMNLCLGNEQTGSFGINYAIISLTQTAGVATIRVASPFKTHVGDTFTIYGSNRAQYNSTFTVTYINPARTNEFQFAVDPATANPGTGTAYSMSISQLNNNIRQLATDVKAVYNLGKINYGEFNGLTDGLYPYPEWATNGLGGLDYLAFHVYPKYGTRPNYAISIANSSNGQPFIAALATLGPDKLNIGELNLDEGSTSAISYESKVSAARQLYLESHLLGIKRICMWSWESNLPMHSPSSGLYDAMWAVFMANNGRINLLLLSKVRTPVTGRTTVTGRTAVTTRTTI